MRTKRWMKCEMCGKKFWAGPSSRFCPECRQLRRKQENTMTERICFLCHQKFIGPHNAKYCPSYRKEVHAQRNREYQARKRAEKSVKIGVTARKCKRCGHEFIIKSAINVYCPNCQKEAQREYERKEYREKTKTDKAKLEKHFATTRYLNRRCVICGRPIIRRTSIQICDDELCRKYFLYLRHARNSYRMGRRKNLRQLKRLVSALGLHILTILSLDESAFLCHNRENQCFLFEKWGSFLWQDR